MIVGPTLFGNVGHWPAPGTVCSTAFPQTMEVPTQPIPKKLLQIRTDKPRPHVCGVCTRGFARLEHLKRHERSHTNEKPFQCAGCGRCFARRDLVLRHQQKLHLHLVPVVRRLLEALVLLDTDNVIVLHNNLLASAPLPLALLLPQLPGLWNPYLESQMHVNGVVDLGQNQMNPMNQISQLAQLEEDAGDSAPLNPTLDSSLGTPVDPAPAVPLPRSASLALLGLGFDFGLDRVGEWLELDKGSLGYVMATHQFHDPAHPHHIKGTTPVGFALPLAEMNDPLLAGALPSELNLLADLKRPAEPELPLGRFKRNHLGFHNDTADLAWVDEVHAAERVPRPAPLLQPGFSHLGALRVVRLFNASQARLACVDTAPDSFVTAELRRRIVEVCGVADGAVPELALLRAYAHRFEHLTPYLPYVHMPLLRLPMVDNFENIPLILGMCALGALHLCHPTNAALLQLLSQQQMCRFFALEVTVEKLAHKKVPLMAHQCLVLHVLMLLFGASPDSARHHACAMAGLVRATNFHHPLERFLAPPPPASAAGPELRIQNSYDYFTMAQTRVRTLHVFYQVHIVGSLLGNDPVALGGAELRLGSFADELLWALASARTWWARYTALDKPSLTAVLNNAAVPDMYECLARPAAHTDLHVLLLLCYVHEHIGHERRLHTDALAWRLGPRPRLERMVAQWEAVYARSSGVLVDALSRRELALRPTLRLLVPLWHLAKLRLLVHTAPVVARAVRRDYTGFKELLPLLAADPEALAEAVPAALAVWDLWVHNSALEGAGAVRTPVFILVALFVATAVLAQALRELEQKSTLSLAERAQWVAVERTVAAVEAVVPVLRTEERLLGHVLDLAVHLLADAPIWPVAVAFAEALDCARL